MRSVVICILGLVSMVTAWDPIWLQPEQVHLSATGDPTQMMVTWSTFSDTKESTVEFGFQVENMTMTASGSRTKFVDGGTEKHTQYIHRVTLTKLKPGSLYMYRCGSSYGWSTLFYFRALPSDPTPKGGIRFAVYGDMGNENAQSLGRLQVEAQDGMYDAILHVGVDLYIGAHEHSYERMWPVYDNKVYNGSMDAPYTNPKAPVHIITGSAGNREPQSRLLPRKSFTAFQSRDFGYTRFFILNSTHIHAEQVSDDKGGQVIDKFTLIKDQHGPEAWL
ncbi:acid phosphatase type 7-like [Amphiura filiformis]|uniref:acid phosphatase type 7-like n=1 Tax=Amphiura filiformis TaxID=82378 RepID=UPI003B21E175